MDNCISYPAIPHMAPVKKAAELYGLSPWYIRRLCREGKIRFVDAGHRWLVNLDSLARYFEQGDPAPAASDSAAPSVRRVWPDAR